MTEEPWPSEWMRGVLELCVLAVLSGSPAHGYAIAQRLEDAGLGVIKGGTLYPLLNRLETAGLLLATWQAGTGGPGRKVFELTGEGRLEARRRARQWTAFTGTAAALLHPLMRESATREGRTGALP